MSDWREFTGKTVDDALTNALVELETTSDKVEYEVLEEGSSGILGLFSKAAVIRVKKLDDIRETAVEFLNDVFKAMEMDVDIEIEYNEVENQMNIELSGDEMGMLIGKRGAVTLDSLQYLVSLVINKKTEEYVKVKIDTENYRQRRKETLENLARNLAHKVKRIHKSVILEPMNPYERRVIHSTLQNDKYVETHSEGEEPYRKVVISLKPGFEKEYDKKKKYGYGNKSRYRNNGGYKKYNNSYRKNYNRYDENKDVVLDETKKQQTENSCWQMVTMNKERGWFSVPFALY